jgi:hypothetical protein
LSPSPGAGHSRTFRDYLPLMLGHCCQSSTTVAGTIPNDLHYAPRKSLIASELMIGP